MSLTRIHPQCEYAVSFQMYSSHVRIDDQAGSIVNIDPLEMHLLPPIQTVLRYGKGDRNALPVHLVVELTPLGTVELLLHSRTSDHIWKLEFQLKSASGQEDALLSVGQDRQEELLDQNRIKELKLAVQRYFEGGDPVKDFMSLSKGKWGLQKAIGQCPC